MDDESKSEYTHGLFKKTRHLETEPLFLVDEIKFVVKTLKSNKSPGHDKITNEYMKWRDEKLQKIFTKLFNQILKTGKIPDE